MNLNELFAIVQEDLTAVENELISIIQSPMFLFRDIGTHLVRAGGKRLRPALFLLCAKQEKQDNPEKIPLAMAVELIHMATLVHDDVIDFADIRRGKPTANVIFGNHSSVLAGDYLFAKAFSIVAQHSSPDRLRILTDAIAVMCEGEILQAKDLYSLDQSIADYFYKINCKTADFIAASCRLGGQAAQYNRTDIDALHQYGYCIGMAFQITDDILDVTAQAAEVGKPTGNDLKQGIITLPALYALQQSGKQAQQLRRIIESKAITDLQLEQALNLIREGGAVEHCYEQADHYLQRAREFLPKCLPENVYTALVTVTDFIGKRIC